MNEPKRLRRKPTEINAIMWTGENEDAIERFGVNYIIENGHMVIYVAANKVWLPIEYGEWIAKDFIGYYPIKNEAVLHNYEEVQL